METFNKKESFIFGGTHKLAPPPHNLDEDARDSFKLNTTDDYRVEIDGKYWLSNFVRWHGAHALFLIPKRFNYAAIWHEELRRRVKRIRNM